MTNTGSANSDGGKSSAVWGFTARKVTAGWVVGAVLLLAPLQAGSTVPPAPLDASIDCRDREAGER
jgi:hypothetical protein